ncbi:MAG: LysM domain-containing protein, partial [Gammaproteobacteria bacterium]
MNSFPSARRALRQAALVLLSSSLILLAAGPAPVLSADDGVPLRADHPERYVVKRGDTLWDIAAMFLRDPWYWPEIWYVNPQIENP